jgi:hypothetical protein
VTLLSRQEIIGALTRLGQLAQANGHQIELLAVGGAVMVLAYNARLATHDVDVFIVSPKEAQIARTLAQQVAQEFEWPDAWLNDGAKRLMAQIEQIAKVALQRESLILRSLVQEFLRNQPVLADDSPPQTEDQIVVAMSAALLELLALRTGQNPPAWTASIGPVAEPVYLLKAAAQMKRLKQLCFQESPEPLRKRKFYAPPDYLVFA